MNTNGSFFVPHDLAAPVVGSPNGPLAGLSATGAAPDAAAAATRAGGQPLDGPPRPLEGVVQRKRLPGPARGRNTHLSEIAK